MHKHRAGSPVVPFAREFTATPVNRRSHAKQGVPRIWAVARQADYHTQFNGTKANLTNFNAEIYYHLITAEMVKNVKLISNTWHH